MANILINTTSVYPEVYAKYNDKYFEYRSKEFNSHSQNLIPLLQKFLLSNDLNLHDIENVFFITGPGSYTGIRIGISCVIGLELALKLKVVPLSLFEAYFLKYKDGNADQVLVLLDSKKNSEYYFYDFRRQENVFCEGVVSSLGLMQLVQENAVVCGAFDYEKVIENVHANNVYFDNDFFDIKQIFNNEIYLQSLDAKLEACYLKKTIFKAK